ncbi:MAG: hypothetical protein K2J82_10625 [Muribaculaceae bacterium]|nr:hypothetical protein [Muribaculaceae bacterium]MDE6755049.1 hypothetical protein [Muribaculaceae bacterium]
MKKIIDYLLVVVIFCALQSCSKDEPKHIDPERLSGEWFLTNIRGWEYDNDAHDKKYEFNETFNFNGQGIPVGSNTIDAQKVRFSVDSFDSESGSAQLTITSFYWSLYDQEWKFDDSGTITLKGDQLIDGTMKATIIKLTEANMTIYQKDEDGETYITYTKLSY